jgi:tRNA(Ile)-lysidine synthase
MSDLLNRFIEHVKQHQLFSKDDKLLIAVSGGVDSVVLTELCKQAGFDFAIAHCNFQLRGEESERDEAFVKKLAENYGVRVFIERFDTEKYAAENKLSIQEAARKLRYDWFSTLIPSALLLTAHHADDNIETLFMLFARGTGLQGLTGIPEKAGKTRRPLLPFFKEELKEFAIENRLAYVEDSSNDLSKYTRNHFRNEIIPLLSQHYPTVKENLQDNINRFKEIKGLYDILVDGLIKKLSKQKGNEMHIPVKQLLGYNNRALIYEIISRYGFSEKQVTEVEKLGNSDTGKYISSHSHRIIRHRHWFIITPLEASLSVNIIIDEGIKEISMPLGKIRIETMRLKEPGVKPPSGSLTADGAVLDSRNIVFPLLLRKWRTADYFYPLGMKKKKKISRFLIDLKIAKTQKEKTWVIESDKRIIWVVGHRIDDRFKITDKTEEVIRLQLTPSE